MPAKRHFAQLLGRSIWFWVAVVGAVALAAFLVHTDTFSDQMEAVTDWAEGVMDDHPVLGAGVFFGLSAVSAMIGFASSAVLVPPATEAWGMPLTFVLLWGGWLVGVVIAYWVGGRARPLVAKLGLEKDLHKLESFVSKQSRFWIILLFCLAAPSEIAGYLLGSIHYPFVKFVAAMGASEAVFAVGVIAFGDSLKEANPWMLLAAGCALIAVAVGAGYWLTRMKKKGKSK